MAKQDIRWQQRFANFERAFLQLQQAVELYGEEAEPIIKEGVIQRFEFTHELAWKVMKDFLEYEGHQNITGSRSATKIAFSLDLIEDGQVWMDMIESRNNTVHTYHEEILTREFAQIVSHYYPNFLVFYRRMKSLI